MTHADFRRLQAKMDEAGIVTCINTIRVSKKPRYKYRYEVVVNSQIVKTCKSRRTAKKILVNLYDANRILKQAMKKVEKLNKTLGITIK